MFREFSYLYYKVNSTDATIMVKGKILKIVYQRNHSISTNHFQKSERVKGSCKPFIDDTRIILNFLSFTGIPNIEPYVSGRLFANFQKVIQYVFAIFLLCTLGTTATCRFRSIAKINKNVAVNAPVITISLSNALLKFFLIIKMKKINVIFQSLLRFTSRYQVAIFSEKKIVIICCSISFLLPIAFVVYYGSATNFTCYINYFKTSFTSNNISKYFMHVLFAIASAINSYIFSLIATILLSYIYTSYCRLTLQPLIMQLKTSLKLPTTHNIKICLDMYAEAKKIRHQIEDFTAINAFFLYGLFFTSILYLIGKYLTIEEGTFSTVSKVRLISTVAQMIILCMPASKAVSMWQNIREITQEIPHYRVKFYNNVRNSDMLLFWSLFETTKNDLSFTCFGILILDWNLLLKTFVSVVTFGVLMI